LAKHVADIANEYPAADKQKYQTAAQKFRIPCVFPTCATLQLISLTLHRYWDWALNADLPDVVSRQRQVTLNTPQGSKTINNPLYSYTFHPMYSDFGDGLPDEKMVGSVHAYL
jgi:tyrosinase